MVERRGSLIPIPSKRAAARSWPNIIYAQLADHAPFGGVVPEIAARAHLDHLDVVIRRTLDDAGIELSQLDGIAATAGPGFDRRRHGRRNDSQGDRSGIGIAFCRGQSS